MKCKGPRDCSRGFSLIEVLVTVGIISILAAIAVPNLLQAQVRAKVSTAKADLFAIATALEAYAVDENDYPPDVSIVYEAGPDEPLPPAPRFRYEMYRLSTPVAYMTNAYIWDIFGAGVRYPERPGLGTVNPHVDFRPIYRYDKPNGDLIDISPQFGEIRWTLRSLGPDRLYPFGCINVFQLSPDFDPEENLFGANFVYDPTNGATSWGDIIRTQAGMGRYSGARP